MCLATFMRAPGTFPGSFAGICALPEGRSHSGLSQYWASNVLKWYLPLLCVGVILKSKSRERENFFLRSRINLERKSKKQSKNSPTFRKRALLDAISFSMAMMAWLKVRMLLVMLSDFFFTSSFFSSSSCCSAARRAVSSRCRNSRSSSKSSLICFSVAWVWF